VTYLRTCLVGGRAEKLRQYIEKMSESYYVNITKDR
jgi:hypothetical protein